VCVIGALLVLAAALEPVRAAINFVMEQINHEVADDDV